MPSYGITKSFAARTSPDSSVAFHIIRDGLDEPVVIAACEAYHMCRDVRIYFLMKIAIG